MIIILNISVYVCVYLYTCTYIYIYIYLNNIVFSSIVINAQLCRLMNPRALAGRERAVVMMNIIINVHSIMSIIIISSSSRSMFIISSISRIGIIVITSMFVRMTCARWRSATIISNVIV